jgi:hypothetical protein
MAKQQVSEWGKKWGQIVARAWADEGFKSRLLADPAAVLRESGLEVPPGVQVQVGEDTDQVFHLILPQKPRDEELTDQELQQIVAATAKKQVKISM